MASSQHLSLAGGAQGFNWLPVFVAEEHGIFAKHGLVIEYKKMGTVDKATTAVLEGEADLAITPPEGAVANFVKGGELRVIASNSNRLPMSLVAQPSIKTVKDLKGKKVGTSSLTEGTAIYTQLLLSKEGLRYPGDYEFELAGIHTKRWAALAGLGIAALMAVFAFTVHLPMMADEATRQLAMVGFMKDLGLAGGALAIALLSRSRS